MADPLSEIEQIRARHHRGSDVNLEGEHYCEDCWGRDAYWPCDASLLLAALSAYEDKFNAMDDDVTRAFAKRAKEMERAEAAEAALSEAEAERDAWKARFEDSWNAMNRAVDADRVRLVARLEVVEGALRGLGESCHFAAHPDTAERYTFFDCPASPCPSVRAALAQEQPLPLVNETGVRTVNASYEDSAAQEHTEPRAATSYFHGTPFGQLPADPPEREWNDRGERGDQGL